jgi:hypothetical protein
MKYELKDRVPYAKYQCERGQNYQFRYRPKLENLNSFEVSWLYDLEYGRCHLAQAIDLIAVKDFHAAKLSLEAAQKLSPLSARIQERLCHVLKNLNSSETLACERRLEELITYSNQQYYLLQY